MTEFGTVSIIGTGLIGGSIGLALKKRKVVNHIVGYDADALVLREALQLGAVDGTALSAAAAIQNSDIVVIAAPVEQTRSICECIASRVPDSAVVTDVGSAKKRAVADGDRYLAGRFLGGHPMAGRERSGIRAADPDLFEDARWILTPTARTDPAVTAHVGSLVRQLGAFPVEMNADLHDEVIARISHLPQLVASALMAAVTLDQREDIHELIGGGFRDVTRIAVSDPKLWRGIISANSVTVAAALEEFIRVLTGARLAITKENWDELEQFLSQAREQRLGVSRKSNPVAAPSYITVRAADRPGVLAGICNVAAMLNLNIEDLRIVHSTEGGSGRITLAVSGAATDHFVADLTSHGFSAEYSRE